MRSFKTIMAALLLATFFMSSGVAAQDEDWFDKGLKLLGQQRYDDAIEAFSTAIEIIPRDYQAYNYRGVAWAMKQNFGNAIVDFSKAIEIRPRYAEAYNNRGFVQTQQGDLPAALDDYTRALEINPFFVDAYNNKAWLLATCADRRIRNGAEAVRLAQKAVELKPDVGSMDTLAAAYAAAGNFDSAINTQKKAIQQLMLADKNTEVPKYLAHLKSYKSRQSLYINYAAARQNAMAQNEKISLKTRTEGKPPPSVSAAKAEAQTQKALAAAAPSKPAAAAQKATAPNKKISLKAQTKGKPSPSVSTAKAEAKTQKAQAALKLPKPPAAAPAGKTVTAAAKPSAAAKTQTSAAAPKTPKPAAHGTIAAPAEPSPAAQPQSPVVAAKTPKPAATTKKTQRVSAAPAQKTVAAPIKPLPYTIQISAFQDAQRSNQVARKLNTNGDPAFTSPVDIFGKGKWYRVYIGNYVTLEEARAVADELKRRKFRYVNVTRKPYTVQVGPAVARDDARKLKSRLQAKGYFSYSLPAANHPNQVRILVGAYDSEKAANGLVHQLKKDGFAPKVGLK